MIDRKFYKGRENETVDTSQAEYSLHKLTCPRCGGKGYTIKTNLELPREFASPKPPHGGQ